jgi:hypothetical protein
MPFIEQLLFGVNLKEDKPKKSVLARSPGMGQEVSEEIVRLCDNWGLVPTLGLEKPALMSFRLDATMPAVAGRLFTVIRVSNGLNPLFHAVTFSEGTYASFLRNPFAVAKAVNFLDTLEPNLILKREEIEFDPSVPLVDPLPNEEDIGLVDEAVLKFISDGKLSLPIEQTNAQSERCMALIIACMPEKDRKNLRFASFAPSESNQYTLVGLQTEGCVFAGWKRMMMAWVSGEYVEQVDKFITEIRAYLEAGDLAGISRTSQRHQFHSASVQDPLDIQRRSTISASMPVQGFETVRKVRSIQSAPSRPDLGLSGLAKSPQRPAVNQALRMPVPGPSGDPGKYSFVNPRKLSPLKRKKPGAAKAFSRRGFSGSQLIRGAVAVLIVGMAVTAGVMWKEGKTLAESLEWANLQGIMGENPRTERAATLLEVVDVGEVYDRQLKQVTGMGKGLNPSLDKGRRKVLVNLREDAASPLNQQVELFAKLASDGIQQGGRPDRESQRMRSLANQGLVLENELARLELAWYSLAGGVFWNDLNTLSDAMVISRRDSLTKVGKGVLEDARRDLGTVEAKLVLDQTRGHVDGMASLLSLFEAKSWSLDWEMKLTRAAGQVSTTASRMTRAYANSAFALVRLKKAERKAEQTILPFRSEIKDEVWPSAEIGSILTNLRAQTIKFSNGQAPHLLTETLELYSALKKPATLAAEAKQSSKVLGGLASNRAVRFHPEAYQDFLERIRYEAALLSLQGEYDPTLIPDHLYAGADKELVVGFRDTMSTYQIPETWDRMAAAEISPFLARWAGHLGSWAGADLDRHRREFDEAWIDCRQDAVKLQGEVTLALDWTETWKTLHAQCQTILAAHADVLGQDPERAVKLADVNYLAVALKAPLPLGLLAGTIRLDQDRMLEPTEAILEIKVVPDGEVWRSDKFKVGPDSTEGMGWVGTVALETTLGIESTQGLEVKVISEKRDEILLMVTCPPLIEGVGPGGLARPRSGGRGSVSLKIDPAYWRSLQVPGLGMIF